MARGEPPRHRAAGVGIVEIGDRDQYIRGVELIEHVAPPQPAAPPGLAVIDEQRIAPRTRWPDVVDPARARLILGPGALPWIAHLVDQLRTRRNRDRNQQHGRRTLRLRFATEIGIGALAVEDHPEPGNVTPRPELLTLDHDRGDHRSDLRIGQLGSLEAFPSLALRRFPALGTGILGILAGHIDLDPGDRNVARCRDRGDPALTIDLREQRRSA